MEHPELETLTPLLQSSIEEEDLQKGLTMPVEAKINDLQININQIGDDLDAFTSFGISAEEIVTELSNAVLALRSAETLYTVDEQESAEADIVWRSNKTKLYRWRTESTARLTYIGKEKNDEALLKSLEKIGSGEGHPDAIQDGHELLELTERYLDDLKVYKLTDERVSEAKAVVAAVADAFPRVSAGAEADKSTKELRDRAFWYCCKLERKLKEDILPLVFFDNYKRRQEYGSHYKRELKKRSGRKESETARKEPLTEE